MAKDAQTPMLRQYEELRTEVPADTLLLFRLGDFYEMFRKDAEDGARILGITLTQRNGMPMAGIPHHAADAYLAKLLAAGRRVAICEQTEPAKAGKLVKRRITRILSPGTAIEASQLDERSHRRLAALNLVSGGLAAAWMDLSTGDFEISVARDPEGLIAILAGLQPAEILIPEGAREGWRELGHRDAGAAALMGFLSGRPCVEAPDFHFDAGAGAKAVRDVLGVLNLDGFGVSADHAGLGPAGALLAYVTDSLRAKPANLTRISARSTEGTLLLDPATQRNLEILRSVSGAREGSLLDAVDRTATAAGARLLEQWLAAPVLDLHAIRTRQAAVAELHGSPSLLSDLRAELEGVRDVVRIVGRLQNRLRSPRELGGLRDTLRRLPAILRLLSTATHAPALSAIAARIDPLHELADVLDTALQPELPAQLTDGGYIRDGLDAELDRLRGLSRNSKQWIAAFERAEQERTGIRSLKVRYNANFGYFIEVTKANLHLVPGDYVRRQTTVGGERFTTEELREREREILHAEEHTLAREQELFAGLVEQAIAKGPALLRTAAALAELDVLSGWALLARERDYCRPEVEDDGRLEIEEGRHPVVEAVLARERDAGRATDGFVPNDTLLDSGGPQQIVLITGPNMAGKSTYIRQVALIVLLAQIGCWVPARRCRVGLVDRIFSRIGASDDLARGNSTFMVEMNETANILHHATARSLVILDEIGRGTSTYDGLSIAWAVIEHLHGTGAAGPRTLFATHYQELTNLANSLPRLRNHTVQVKEWNDEIIFLRKVTPGAADRSYGIQVARLAGLPEPVIQRARQILGQLTEADAAASKVPVAELEKPLVVPRVRRPRVEGIGQLELF
jgi:DNA mismatch repair protein MutS